ncbi:hypothetical protein AB836_01445 [Rickettsiales bacterium (ex Bugula neritina AB1)]|nr:hypothetical protein AB836_01445 [Rickettsiales bacterium (ex Bugula neritina AB1)]
MLKKPKKNSNSLFAIIVLIIIISYTGVIQLFYLGQYKQSNIFAKTKNVSLRKYDLFRKYYNYEPKNKQELENLQMEINIIYTYLQTQTNNTLLVSTQEAEKYIKNKKEFKNTSNNKFDDKILFEYIEKLSKITGQKISYFDYLEYIKEKIAIETLENIIDENVQNISDDIIKSLRIKEMEIHALKLSLKEENNEDYQPSKKEINEFIKEKQKENGHIYVTEEKRAGFVIRIPINKNSQKISEVVNLYINKKRSSFNENHLKIFMEKVIDESNNFNKSVNLQDIYKRTNFSSAIKNNNKKFLKIEYLEPQEISMNSECIFNDNLGKNFDIYNGEYVRTIVTKIIDKKNKKLSQEDIDKIVIPSLKLEKKLLEKKKIISEDIADHNHNKINLLDSNKYTHEDIIYKNTNNNYNRLLFADLNYGIETIDNSGEPCIIILKKKILLNESIPKISYMEITNYIKKNFFLHIFNLFAQKIKSKGI